MCGHWCGKHEQPDQGGPVDAYANCFVRRDHDTKILKLITPLAPRRPA
jgi:hypothetical protein